ncbi:murein L,D-transpeptidase family protein [Lichenifustis flavocetrariae]|uniref:Murein L,D-transpeptidase n=1 Tax=Lichenifustis flavocetrariae TaxID=2949735 RepID=A0AA41YU18_9HYPH|nr:murein L,D-transpeptidase family protein [Lichenifustis flavocetrariae]MCW6506838.1 murein L,D-transpeptidase [Lichenifustis flavocetrariae]
MALRRSVKLLSAMAIIVASAGLLAGCDSPTESSSGYRAFAPLSPELLASMRAKDTDQNAPMLIRAYKKEAEFEVWKKKRDGKYALLKTYPMCRWSGQLGPKKTEGDRQVPEGFYTITPGQMNPNSHYYLSFNVGYPNAYDRANGRQGGSIMVHGICSSAGCFSMTDKQIEEIYAVARESFAGGQREIQMQSFPFRMTAENMAKLRLDPNMPFWREIKKGADYFDVTKLETPVGVCAKHYVFGTPKAGRFDAFSPCPPLKTDKDTDAAIAAKAAADDREVAELIGKGVKPVKIVYADGGQNPEFAHRVAEVSRPDALAAGASEIALDDSSKAKSAVVQVVAAKSKALVAVAQSAPAAAQAAPAALKVADATPTGSISPGGDSVVPATFTAAPSAYAREEPKTGTEGFFKKWLNLGSSETPEATPAIAAQPTVIAPTSDKKPAPKHIIAKNTHVKPVPVSSPAQTAKPEQLSSAATPLLKVAAGVTGDTASAQTR